MHWCCAQVSRISFTRYRFGSSINFWSFTNRPSAPRGYTMGTSNRFPWMSMYGRVSSLVVGLEDVEECGVGGGGGGSILPFTGCKSRGTSSDFEDEEGGDSPAFGSKEEEAMSSGCERRSSSSKRRGEVDGSGDSEQEAGAEGDSPSFKQVTPSPELERTHRRVEVHHPNSRGHTVAWESITPTRGAMTKRGSPSRNPERPH